jgi:hypothetical protein
MRSSNSRQSILVGMKPNAKILYNFSNVMGQPDRSGSMSKIKTLATLEMKHSKTDLTSKDAGHYSNSNYKTETVDEQTFFGAHTRSI